MLDAKIIDSVASKEECKILVEHASTLSNWDSCNHQFWDNRIINAATIAKTHLHITELMINIRKRMRQKIKEVYNLDQDIYPDLLQMVRWPVGLSQPPHSDAYNIDGSPHVSPWRNYGSVLYLNDDYQGGQTFYSNFDVEIQPKAGSLAVHPADILHYHGVREVKGSTRYTIVVFWTFDQKHYDQLEKVFNNE